MVTVDAFADTDTLAASSECWCIPLQSGEFETNKLSVCIDHLKYKYPNANILLGAGSEQYAAFIEAVDGWTLSACNTSTLLAVNQPKEFFHALSELDIPFPDIHFDYPPASNDWLYKLASSCGGVGVSRSNDHGEKALGGYWQLEKTGLSMSALCISDQQESVIIGINRQYINSNFETYPCLYEGALANVKVTKEFIIKIESYINKLISHFKLVGVFSVDMIVQGDDIFVLEINPRISASYELYECLNPSLNLVDAHFRVCEGERLSNIQINPNISEMLCGYLIIYADSNIEIPENMNWPDWCKDRPESNRLISIGEPVCSVYVQQEGSPETIRTLLEARREQILIKLKQ